MSDSTSRFTSQTSQNQSTQQRLSNNTIGLVSASDYRKRRAEVLEAQEREARDGSASANTPTDISTPDPTASDSSAPKKPVKKKPKKNAGKKLLSFDDEDDEDDTPAKKEEMKNKFKANASVPVIPKALTKAALLKEATERETLRQEFLAQREAIKATEIAIPFIFYDGADIPGGTVRVTKGDFVWVFLDKSRKVGAELGVGDNATRAWARVGVDDLMLVRGTIIIPHHYDFYFFLANKSLGPNGQRIFPYSAEAPSTPPASASLFPNASKADVVKREVEGAGDEPSLTKVVDRRWYERNKHIYPASTWQDFDAEKDYSAEVRRDAGGNAFFFSR